MLDRELCHLLDPITPEAFIAHHWERAPLHITGRPDRFRGLFDRAAFERAIRRAPELGILLRVSSDREGDGPGAAVHLPIEPGQVAAYLAQGATVCADPIERGDAELAAYAATIRRQLGHAGQVSVKAYLSTDGHGFNTHYDWCIATTLQIEGSKRWRFSPLPAVPFPRCNALVGPDDSVRHVGRLPSEVAPWERVSVDESTFTEVELVPGDVLCLPAGTWHAAKAVGHSLALNLSFSPLSPLDLLLAALRPLLEADPSWRRNLPARPSHAAGVPRDVVEFLRERIGELATAVAGLDPGGEALTEAWRKAVASPSQARAPQPAFAVLNSLRSALSRLAPPPAAPEPSRGDGTITCTFRVSDLGASIEWYKKALGFRVKYRVDTFGWCELSTDVPSVSIGLSEGQPAGGPGGATITLGVTDIDETRRHLEAMQVRFEGPTYTILGMVRLATFHDPDGNRLMLSQALR
jgi:ribosomal protein L16 Arg81 hydroxylase/catechol 2,3-dioxygenase-like lactoylglutathione lyase family enzyme